MPKFRICLIFGLLLTLGNHSVAQDRGSDFGFGGRGDWRGSRESRGRGGRGSFRGRGGDFGGFGRGGRSSMENDSNSSGREATSSTNPTKLKAKERVTIDLPQSFSDGDTDHDGQIGLYEWRRWKSGQLNSFEGLDQNRDGFLTPMELVQQSTSETDRSKTVETPPASTGDSVVVDSESSFRSR